MVAFPFSVFICNSPSRLSFQAVGTFLRLGYGIFQAGTHCQSIRLPEGTEANNTGINFNGCGIQSTFPVSLRQNLFGAREPLLPECGITGWIVSGHHSSGVTCLQNSAIKMILESISNEPEQDLVFVGF